MPDPATPDDTPGGRGIGPIDRDVLERTGGYLRRSDRFSRVEFQPETAPNSIVASYDRGYFPTGVTDAYLQARWYVTDDFNVHYTEQYETGSQWECRWDRHPNDHNTRDHVHPPPEAATPGVDCEFPRDWRDVMALVLSSLDDRIQAFWE